WVRKGDEESAAPGWRGGWRGFLQIGQRLASDMTGSAFGGRGFRFFLGRRLRFGLGGGGRVGLRRGLGLLGGAIIGRFRLRGRARLRFRFFLVSLGAVVGDVEPAAPENQSRAGADEALGLAFAARGALLDRRGLD